jgi:hypothetical protein
MLRAVGVYMYTYPSFYLRSRTLVGGSVAAPRALEGGVTVRLLDGDLLVALGY